MDNHGFKPGDIIGYRKDGSPIHLQAGGAPEDGELEQPTGDTVSMTKAELDKLLADARNRAYSDKARARDDERVTAMQAELADLQKERSDREKAAEKARKEAEAAARKAAEAELDAKALIEKRSAELQAEYAKRDDEWASRFSGLQSQMEQQAAVFAKEREFQELAAYITAVVNQYADDIVPELAKYITGNTKEEIDASLARVLADSAAIKIGRAHV